jgi:hypothetical protein
MEAHMRGILLVGLMIVAAPAMAQEHQGHAACQAMDAALPAGLDDWRGEAAIATAHSDADAAKADLALGKGYRASLLKTPKVAFSVQPKNPGGSVSFSGLFKFTVETEGAYTVALGSAAWIDVVVAGKSLEPVSFGHGPACTTIRKMVTFALKPGAHLLQVAGNGAESVKLLVAKQP